MGEEGGSLESRVIIFCINELLVGPLGVAAASHDRAQPGGQVSLFLLRFLERNLYYNKPHIFKTDGTYK